MCPDRLGRTLDGQKRGARPTCPRLEGALEAPPDRSGRGVGETINVALYAASVGAAILGALLMAQRWSVAFAYRAGSVLFGLVALVQAANVIDISTTRLPAWAIQLSGGLVAATFPTAWLYLRDLISDTPRRLTRRDAWHFAIPTIFALHVIWAAFILSPTSEASLWGVGEMDAAAKWFGGTGIALSLAWVAQITVYSLQIARELIRLPKRLRQAFANTSGRDLIGLRVLGGLVLAHIPLAVLANLGLIEWPETVFALFGAALTFGLAGLAVIQAPVFQLTPDAPRRIAPGVVDPAPDGVPAPAALPDDADANPAAEKYARSLLDDERLSRIAARIDAAFTQDALHLDPNLSLAKLSERVAVSENHLSQTFTRKIGASFFDYVNGRRIEAAKALLAGGDTSVVDVAVAVGFNSRSAFYNAFKAIAGTTPAAYRDMSRRATPR